MAIETEISPVCSEMRDPKRIRVNRSRPRTSVPSQWRRLGGWSPSPGFITSGSYGVSSGATTAASTSATRITPPTVAPRERRSLRNTSRQGERAARPPTAGGSLEADAGIEVRIREVNQQVDDDVDHGDEQHCTLHEREVLVRNRVDEQLADAGPREHRLGNHSPGQQRTELQPHDGNHGDEGVLQHVPADDQGFTQTLRPCRSDKRLPQHLDHTRPDQPRERRRRDETERNGGQYY